MRSAIIAATFALSALAAPLPEAEPIYKSGGQSCRSWVGGVCVAAGKREASASSGTGIEAQLPVDTIRHQRDLGDEVDEVDAYTTHSSKDQKRSPVVFHRPKGSRSAEDDDSVQVEARFTRAGQRSAEPEPFSRGSHPPRSEQPQEKRSPVVFHRPKGSRSTEHDGAVQIEARFTRAGQRSAEPEPFSRGSHPPRSEESQEKRSPVVFHRPKNARSIESEQEAELGFEPRTIRGGSSNKRGADPEPVNRIHGGSGPTRWSTHTADPEPVNRSLSSREADPFSRAGAGKRFADPEAVNRNLNSREAEPFSRAGAGKRFADPEAEPFGRAGAGKRSADSES